jgi:hypothetical protein
MDFVCFAQNGFFELEVRGLASAEYWPEMQRTIYSHPGWKPGAHLLANFTDVIFEKVSDDDICQASFLTIKQNHQFGNGRLAILILDDFGFGLGRMFEAYCSEKLQGEICLFRHRCQAESWLKSGSVLQKESNTPPIAPVPGLK